MNTTEAISIAVWHEIFGHFSVLRSGIPVCKKVRHEAIVRRQPKCCNQVINLFPTFYLEKTRKISENVNRLITNKHLKLISRFFIEDDIA